MRNFRELIIWQQGISIVEDIYQIANTLPQNERFGLYSQITRAAVSIPSNIAEGCSRSSEIEYKRFLEIAIGSLFELETQLIVINKLNFIPYEVLNPILQKIKVESKQINSLLNKIKANSQKLKTKG